ncbi:E3 ubiquitin-protein ligase NEDD4 [Cricetulus griseus]|uniref:E3 ubiquitin-protein ligase NEDD4 n=1 Tax=Cricetulus griseus TaxID=10029 RepID=G3GYG5_CRIGR|nr:E3 ubiquitin-protein ligase NEDD4 [Cricetulus griseus]
MNAYCLKKSEQGFTSPGTGVIDDCEPPCRYWESNSDLLQEQQVLLTAKPSLKPKMSLKNQLWNTKFQGSRMVCFVSCVH